MKKLIALFTLGGFLISVTSAGELFKLRAVITHFEEHRQSDSSIGFIRFIVMHYVTDDGNAMDNEKDEGLPFKSPTLANYSLIATQSAVILFSGRKVMSEKYYRSADDFIYVRGFACMVWHPPQWS